MSFSEWKEYSFSELMDIIGGGTPKTKVDEYWNGDIPWLSVKDFNNDNRIVYETEKNITQLGLENSSTKILNKGDLIISARGTVGALAQLGMSMAFNQSCYGLRANELTNNNFLYYLLKYRLKNIQQNTHGSVFDTITRETFSVLKAKIPDNLQEQKAIANILSALDEKIETNNQINKKLEEMAQAIFKQWFVDFEFPCIHENYKFSRASKPEERHEVSGEGKPKDFERVCTYKRVGGLPVPDGESWFVYVLLCEDETFYKGMTKDLYRRFYEHFTGIGAEYTKAHKPVKVIHYEQFATQEEARKREEELKSGYGREWIKREYAKYLQDEENIKQSIIENSGSPAQENTSTSRFTIGSPAREYTRKSKFMIAGEMLQSEIGMIPKGLEYRELGDLCNITSSKRIFMNEYVKDGIPFYRGKEIIERSKGSLVSTELYISMEKYNEIKEKFSVPSKGDILLTSVGTLGIPYKVDEEKFYFKDGNLTWFKDYIQNEYSNYIYLWILSNEGRKSLDSITIGSTQKALTIASLKKLKLITPNISLLKKFELIVSKLIDKIYLNNIEKANLIKARDTLLPKLMSGEIRVPLK